MSIKDKACITGIGGTAHTRGPGRPVLDLVLEASFKAIADAGLTPGDIDGFVLSSSRYVFQENLQVHLGIEDLRYSAIVEIGGASPVAALATAAMAVSSGICRHVLLPFGWNGYSEAKTTDRMLPGNISYTENQMSQAVKNYYMPHGAFLPMQYYALIANRHRLLYGTQPEELAQIPLVSRRHANTNPDAFMFKRPLTLEDYLASPTLCEPFRMFDCCLETDGANAVIVSAAENARDMPHRPVYISSVAEGHPYPADDLIGRPNILDIGLTHISARAFAQADAAPSDMRFAQVYDCFSYVVLMQLEAAGFCARGEARHFVRDGNIGIGGALPINTHGGCHSEGHTWGMSHIVEATRQLRGTSPNQVPDARIGAVTGWGDFGDGAIAILRN